ncbi:unnamed protein product [Choristocarpus tenellus]
MSDYGSNTILFLTSHGNTSIVHNPLCTSEASFLSHGPSSPPKLETAVVHPPLSGLKEVNISAVTDSTTFVSTPETSRSSEPVARGQRDDRANSGRRSDSTLHSPVVEEWVEAIQKTGFSCGEGTLTPHFSNFIITDMRSDEQEEEGRYAGALVQAPEPDAALLESPDRILCLAVLRGEIVLNKDQSSLIAARGMGGMVVKAVRFLVDNKGANVNCKDYWQRTPLHLASATGNVDLIRFFLQRGADVNTQDVDLRTPLHLACSSGHVIAVKRLTRPEVEARLDIRDSRGLLPGQHFREDVPEKAQVEVCALLASALNQLAASSVTATVSTQKSSNRKLQRSLSLPWMEEREGKGGKSRKGHRLTSTGGVEGGVEHRKLSFGRRLSAGGSSWWRRR